MVYECCTMGFLLEFLRLRPLHSCRRSSVGAVWKVEDGISGSMGFALHVYAFFASPLPFPAGYSAAHGGQSRTSGMDETSIWL